MTTTVGTRKVDTSRGEMKDLLSREWASRPDDERFLSLDDLLAHVSAVQERSFESTTTLRDLRFDGIDGDRLVLLGDGGPVDFTHWSFGQTCRFAGAPAGYLRSLPVDLAATCLQASSILNGGVEAMQLLDREESKLRAMTGPKYGRIANEAVIKEIQTLATSSDVQWKVPGCMDWSTGCYDPNVPVTKESTTLYASDRDCAVFLCDDLEPIEVGKLSNGDPDLMFRGIFARNSEVGFAKLEVFMMYLRGICQNRCLWGVEGFKSYELRHTHWAPEKFRDDIMPILRDYHRTDPSRLVEAVSTLKEPMYRLKGDDESEREQAQIAFLKECGFGEKIARSIIDHKAPGTDSLESVWDVANQITSYAQTRPWQDERLEYERRAGALMDRVAA